MSSRCFGLFGSIAASLLLLIQAEPAGGASRARTTVKLVSAGRSIRTGTPVTVTVKILQGDDVGSVPFTLRYDASILEFVASSQVEGNFLGKDGAATSFIVSPMSPSHGGSVVVGLSRLAPGRGARGSGTLCRLTFRARQPGVSPLTFSRAWVLDPAARPLPASFLGSSITVSAAP